MAQAEERAVAIRYQCDLDGGLTWPGGHALALPTEREDDPTEGNDFNICTTGNCLLIVEAAVDASWMRVECRLPSHPAHHLCRLNEESEDSFGAGRNA